MISLEQRRMCQDQDWTKIRLEFRKFRHFSLENFAFRPFSQNFVSARRFTFAQPMVEIHIDTNFYFFVRPLSSQKFFSDYAVDPAYIVSRKKICLEIEISVRTKKLRPWKDTNLCIYCWILPLEWWKKKVKRVMDTLVYKILTTIMKSSHLNSIIR